MRGGACCCPAPLILATEESSAGSPFSLLLRRYRIDAGLSQEALAECAKLSTRAVSDLERGVRRLPYRATVA